MKTAIEVLKDYYDKDNIFQSVKMAMEEYSSLQNRSLVEENDRLEKENKYIKEFILEMYPSVQNSFVKQAIDGLFLKVGKPALSYKEETKNG